MVNGFQYSEQGRTERVVETESSSQHTFYLVSACHRVLMQFSCSISSAPPLDILRHVDVYRYPIIIGLCMLVCCAVLCSVWMTVWLVCSCKIMLFVNTVIPSPLSVEWQHDDYEILMNNNTIVESCDATTKLGRLILFWENGWLENIRVVYFPRNWWLANT